jgi:YaiO family outer membrane protein
MRKRSLLWLTLPLALSAQEDPFLLDPPQPSTTTRVAVGAYDQSFSDGFGPWKGWTLEGTIYPAQGGPWVLSATGFDRPEGKGTLFSAGKYVLLGEASSVFAGLSGGTNSDFLPQVRGDLDFHLDVGSGWKADLAGAYSSFAQNDRVWMLQAGPAYQGEGWSVSLRAQRLSYQPGGDSDTGGILNFRLGGNDFGVWHNLRLAAGRGIIESTSSGGGLATGSMTMSGSGGRFGRGSMGSTTTLPVATPQSLAQERFASLTGHWPLTDRLAIKAEASWGEKVSTYHFWGSSIQMVFSF